MPANSVANASQLAAVQKARRRLPRRRLQPARKTLPRELCLALHTADGDLLTARPIQLPNKLRFPSTFAVVSKTRTQAMQRMGVPDFNMTVVHCKDGVKVEPVKPVQLGGGGFADDYEVEFPKDLDEEVFRYVQTFGEHCAAEAKENPAEHAGFEPMTRQEHLELYEPLRRACSALAGLLEGRFFRPESFDMELTRQIHVCEQMEAERVAERAERQRQERWRSNMSDAEMMAEYYSRGGQVNGYAAPGFDRAHYQSGAAGFNFDDYEDAAEDVMGDYYDGYDDDSYGANHVGEGQKDGEEMEEDDEHDPGAPNLAALKVPGLDADGGEKNIVNALLRKTTLMLIEHSRRPDGFATLGHLERFLAFVPDQTTIRDVLELEIIWGAICDTENLPHYPRWILCANKFYRPAGKRPVPARFPVPQKCSATHARRVAGPAASEDSACTPDTGVLKKPRKGEARPANGSSHAALLPQTAPPTATRTIDKRKCGGGGGGGAPAQPEQPSGGDRKRKKP